MMQVLYYMCLQCNLVILYPQLSSFCCCMQRSIWYCFYFSGGKKLYHGFFIHFLSHSTTIFKIPSTKCWRYFKIGVFRISLFTFSGPIVINTVSPFFSQKFTKNLMFLNTSVEICLLFEGWFSSDSLFLNISHANWTFHCFHLALI